MDDYLIHNRQVYDSLAEEFREKLDIREESNKHIALNFLRVLNKRFNKETAQILELGPGAGDVCKEISEKGYSVTAIEFSEKMAEVCKDVAPKTDVIIGEFSSYDFGGRKFSGIIATAFIHLFPSSVTPEILKKIRSLLEPNGILYIGTTENKTSNEGLYPKMNFKKKLMRYRRKFTRVEFEEMLDKARFKIIEKKNYKDKEEEGKVWMDYIIEAA